MLNNGLLTLLVSVLMMLALCYVEEVVACQQGHAWAVRLSVHDLGDWFQCGNPLLDVKSNKTL